MDSNTHPTSEHHGAAVDVGSGPLFCEPCGHDPQAAALAPRHAHPMHIKPLLKLYAVCDPQGHINHTTIAPTDTQAIELWMSQEQTITPILRGTPAQSWEVFEAEGYRAIRVDVIPT